MTTDTPPEPTADAPAVSGRRFTIIDAMILVASVAVGMVPLRILSGQIRWEYFRRMLGDVSSLSPTDCLKIIETASLFATCIAVPLSLALIVLRSVRPIPEAARAAGQPGALGLKVALAVMLIVLAASLPSLVSANRNSSFLDFVTQILFFLGSPTILKPTAVAFLAVFLTQRSSGRIARPVDWVERSARWLCWYWIVVGLAVPVLF